MATTDDHPQWARLLDVSGGGDLRDGILFAVPYLAIFAVFLLYPLLKGLYMSLFHWNAFVPSQSQFVFLDNYAKMFGDPAFWKALRATVYFVVLTVPTLVILGLLLALGVNRDIRGKRFLRTVFFSPYVLTVSVVALIWQEIYAPSYGPLNYYLQFDRLEPALMAQQLRVRDARRRHCDDLVDGRIQLCDPPRRTTGDPGTTLRSR